MGRKTGIAWCEHTFNMIWGCTKVSAGCINCYAETLAKRFGYDVWGANARRVFGDEHWKEPLKWNRDAEKEGVRRSVFADSMCDVFERLPESHPSYRQVEVARAKLFKLTQQTLNLDWLLVTKRTENIASMLPVDWGKGYPNVWLIATVEDQAMTKRLGELLAVPAVVRGLSCEPLLGKIDLEPYLDRLDWVIVGGESGPDFRSMDLDWARDLRDQCARHRVPFFYKQESGVHPNKEAPLLDGHLRQERPLSKALPSKQVLKSTDQTRELGIVGWEVKIIGVFPDGSRDVIVRNPVDQTEHGPYCVWLSDIIKSEH